MSKKLSVMVAILGLLIVFSAGVFAAERVELTFWGCHTSEPELQAAMKTLIDQFNEEHPNIYVRYESVSGEMVYPKFLTAARGSQMPDIADGYSYHPLQFAAMDQVMPLDDVIEEWAESGLLDDIASEYAYKKFYWDGHYWGVPWELDIRAIFYRKDLLEAAGIAPPRDWDEFRDAVLKLNDPQQGIFGFVYPGGNFHIAQHYYMMFMMQNGGSIFDKDNNLIFGTDSYDANVEALKYLTDFAVKHGVTPPGIASYNTDDAQTIFVQGRAAFALCAGAVVIRLMTERPDLVDEFGVLETLRGPVAQLTPGFYNPLFIWKHTPHPEEAKTFLKWFVQPGRLEPLYEARPGQMWPIWKSEANLPVFLENHLLQEAISKVIPFTVDFAYPGYGVPQMGAIDGEKMFAAPLNEVLSGVKTPEKAVSDAHDNMAQLWD